MERLAVGEAACGARERLRRQYGDEAVDAAVASVLTAFPKRRFPAIHLIVTMRCRAIIQSQ